MIAHEDSLAPITLNEVQTTIQRLFGDKDAARGVSGTFMWFMEEVGELATDLRAQDGEASPNLKREFADVLAWLVTLANIAGVDLAEAFGEKYGRGCPGCQKDPCQCGGAIKP